MSISTMIVAGEPTPPSSALLTPQQASDYTGIPVSTLATYRFKKIGPIYYKLNGQIRYRREDLDAWIDSCRITPPTI